MISSEAPLHGIFMTGMQVATRLQLFAEHSISENPLPNSYAENHAKQSEKISQGEHNYIPVAHFDFFRLAISLLPI